MKYTHIGIDDQAKAVANLPALQMRCTLDGVDRPSVSPAVTSPQPENDTTPDKIEGCVVSCHPLAQGDNLEAAGIEPASRGISAAASTCVVELFTPSPFTPHPTRSLPASQALV